MKKENKKSFWTGRKIALTAAIVLIVLVIVGVNLLPALQTVGGSFGYGYPSGKGGRAIRDVEIDVEPQVVYRIDDHRFFTFEKYLACNSGGFVYYNDTKRGIKKFAGSEGKDKKPQNEVSVMQQNDVLSFKGGFIYAAGDDVIAYPGRNVSYKYGGSKYFIIFESIKSPSKDSLMKISYSSIPVIIKDNSIITKVASMSEYYREHKVPLDPEVFDLVNDEELGLDVVSLDDHFHCDDNIKPTRVRYIKD
ncbi:T6SS immunity protein Tli3 family protein [Serratia proteamaculans]